MTTHDAFEARGRSLEEAYFRTKEAETVEKLKSVFQAKLDRESLRAAGLTDETVIDRLLAVSVKGEMLTAFKLFPLVEIAWADGRVDKKEADAVIDAALKFGLPREGETIARLKEWLERGPTADGRTAWRMYAAQLCTTLSPAELASFRADLLAFANKVAHASGGVFGILGQVSPGEQRVIDEAGRALTPA